MYEYVVYFLWTRIFFNVFLTNGWILFGAVEIQAEAVEDFPSAQGFGKWPSLHSVFKCDSNIWNTLQRSLKHCNAFQNTAVQMTFSCSSVPDTFCITLQHTATHYNTLQHTATHCNCNTLQYNEHLVDVVFLLMLSSPKLFSRRCFSQYLECLLETCVFARVLCVILACIYICMHLSISTWICISLHVLRYLMHESILVYVSIYMYIYIYIIDE